MVRGQPSENGLYFFGLHLDLRDTFASSRSMAPVDRSTVHEVFASVEDGSVQKDLLEDDGSTHSKEIRSTGSQCMDNIFLLIPLKA